MEEELFRNKIYVSSPTSISIGNCTWRCLDTKLVGRVKALIEENEKNKEKLAQLKEVLIREDNALTSEYHYDIVALIKDLIQIIDNLRR